MKKEKMNNKGFSLVELIIVIAIMAVLVVVLAPQYLKYVERSRNSTDLQNATAAVTACQVYAADPEAAKVFTAGTTFTIAVTQGAAAAVSSTNTDTKDAATTALSDAKIALGDLKCKSKTKWTAYSIVGTVEADGNITFDYTCSGTDADAFKKAMAGQN